MVAVLQGVGYFVGGVDRDPSPQNLQSADRVSGRGNIIIKSSIYLVPQWVVS